MSQPTQPRTKALPNTGDGWCVGGGEDPVEGREPYKGGQTCAECGLRAYTGRTGLISQHYPATLDSGDNWFYEPVSEAKCPCGCELWGDDWWDGWTDDTSQEVECDGCGTVWVAEIEHQEPCVVDLKQRQG